MHRLFVQCCYDVTYMHGEGNMAGKYMAIVIYNCAFSGCYQGLFAASRLCPVTVTPLHLRGSTPLVGDIGMYGAKGCGF